MKKIWLLLALLLVSPALAQAPQQSNLGFCNIGSVASAVKITTSNCIFASFTGVIANNQLTTSVVTGNVLPGQPLTGAGIPSGAYVVTGLVSGGGNNTAGVYSIYCGGPCAAVSSESMTTAGVPPFAKYALISVQTQAVNWRADGGTPTSSVGGGNPIPAGNAIGFNATTGAGTTLPGGDLSQLQFIQQAATAVVTVDFYQ
jgi:hypothetical protein